MKIFIWVLRIVAAGIMLQTLFFKFSGAPESIYIFETVGMEPFGRYASGIAELIASVLLLIPRTTWLGAILGIGVMLGAIVSHLTILGIEVQGDGGTLFSMAIVVFLISTILLFLHKEDIPIIGARFIKTD
ncbi:MAG: DoxX family protein [Balneolaceae bacterium]